MKFYPNQAHSRRDKCHKCGDSKHIEGFKCPARKYQCRNCHKYGHFTSLCHQKRKSFESRSPEVHQLQIGQIYMQDDPIYHQSGDLTSSDEPFCLQVNVQHTQASLKVLQVAETK